MGVAYGSGEVMHIMEFWRDVPRFLRCTRGGATAIAAVAVTVMTVGGAALITDHLWLTDQRDTLKSASDAAGVAATLEMTRLLKVNTAISDGQLRDELDRVAKRYVEINLSHLPADRLARARSTLVVETRPDRVARTVDVTAEADLGGTLVSRHLPLLGQYAGPPAIHAAAQVERIVHPVEVVLAVDISQSMERCLAGKSRCRNPARMRIAIVKRAAATLVDVLGPSAANQIAIGVVPWHMVVRLDGSARNEWSSRGWADYPASRHYSATYRCANQHLNDCPAPAEDHDLPPTPPQAWQGCLDEHRLGGPNDHASLPAFAELMDLPSRSPFAEAFFPALYGAGYTCLASEPPRYGLNYCYDAGTFDLFDSHRQMLQPVQYGCGDTHPAILPLTSDRAKIDAAIDGLDAVGAFTHSALGVLWGQRLLDHAWKSVWGGSVHPVDPVTDEETRKALVLLTDGDDTYCDMGAGTKRSCEDSDAGVDRSAACAAAKAAGTEIFVVTAMHPNDVSGHLADTLRACSSESQDSDGTYVFLNNSRPENLEAAFADIANQLSTIRRVY